MSDFCDIEIKIDQGDGEEQVITEKVITGKVIFRPKVDLEVRHLGYNFILETRGNIGNHQSILKTVYLKHYGNLTQREPYRFPIKVELKNYETYKGLTTDLLLKIEAFMQLGEVGAPGQDKTSKMKWSNFLGINKKQTFASYLNVRRSYTGFKIVTDRILLEAESGSGGILISGFIGLIALFFIFKSVPMIVVWLILGVVLSVFAYYYWVKYQVGEMNVHFVNVDQKNFKTKLSNPNKWNHVKNITIGYEVVEEVVDDRGSSREYVRRPIYKSKISYIKNPTSDLETDFAFPSDVPGTLELTYLKLYWIYKAKVRTTLGIDFTYFAVFRVARINDGSTTD